MIPKAQRLHAGIALLALICRPSLAQTKVPDPAAAATPTFQIADVHPSPHVNQPYMRGGDLHGDRYIVHQATMVNLIARAYGVENNNVLRGPAWLDLDHFDIVAKAPRTTSPDDVNLMLRDLLADRFKLVAHPDTKPLPAFVLTVGKGGKLKEADGSGEPGCQYKPPPQNPAPGSPPPYIAFSCHGVTMDEFAKDLHNWAGGYLTNPVVNATGSKGAWDFDFKWTSRGDLTRAGADGISIFDCVDKQLGLKLEAKTAPLPVIMVDSVNETPTPNPPGLDKALPPLPPAEFDVAIIKPSDPNTKGINGQIRGGQINLTGATLQWFITWAWDIGDDMIADAPKWLNQDRFDLLAKIAIDPQATPGPNGAPPIDQDDLQQMVKALLADRFKLQSHIEDRPADAYTLFAVNPKLKKADPDNRTGCKEGPGPDGKDPRIANPVLGRLLTCSNMTLAQFGAQLQSLASGYIHVPVLDSTGLTDAYDFTLSFSTAGQLRAPPPPPAPGADPNAAAAPDPTGGLSLFDAISKQMGLKLEKQKRPVPMLVIDHIEEKPTDN